MDLFGFFFFFFFFTCAHYLSAFLFLLFSVYLFGSLVVDSLVVAHGLQNAWA